ncbi:MAG: Uma2 family endonuclease [Leptolyngbyaceae cyanobacterium MO_188.B28]|nr:Uma2 family endonuclease [Leptolyngbyaceae cyanobacterium MO_188.B28]
MAQLLSSSVSRGFYNFLIMIQALSQPVTFEEFIEWYPEHSEHRYELRRGVIIEMPKPRGKHSEVAGFLSGLLFMYIQRQPSPYFIPKECIIRAEGESGYEPDVIVLDSVAVKTEPNWEASSIITQGRSVKLVIEVVSSNWRDDYYFKLADYEALGIPEYWIVDYAALGGRKFIGNPKQPTLSVYTLVDGEYQRETFQGSAKIQSPNFSDLELTAGQVFSAG